MYQLYKIKSPTKDLYSEGMKHGIVKTSKKGRVWNSLNSLKSHLRMVKRLDPKSFEEFYDDWVIVLINQKGMDAVGFVRDFK